MARQNAHREFYSGDSTRAVIRSLRSDEAGVASTVGTIMALLVFLTFISLIVNQYVPAWMKDSEASHMNTALGQFGGIKGSIDLQMLAAEAAQDAGTFHIPVTTATAVGLGVDGVPIFAAATQGKLESNPNNGPFTVNFTYSIQGVRRFVSERAGGAVELDAANRYYLAQRIAYENGAVIRYQLDGQFVRVHPTFSILTANNSLDISFALVGLYGFGAITGSSVEIVSTQLFAYDRQDYLSFPSDAVIWINHTSRYALAWYNFMNQTLAATLKLGGTFGPTFCGTTFTAKIGATSIYSICWSLNPLTGLYTMRLAIYNRPGVMSLSAFRLQHAQVQVGVGDATQQVPF
jgi:hypothetical protein